MSKLFVNTIAPNSGDTVTLSGSLVTTGKLTIGDASTDTVAFEAEISSSLIPDVGATYDLGTMANSWGSLHVHGLGHIHTASINVVSSSLIPDADDTFDLGSSAKQWKDLYVDGTANLDNVSIVQVTSNLIPSNSNNVDLGSGVKQWKDLYVDGVAYIDTIDKPTITSPTITGTGSIDATHITASNLSASTFTLRDLPALSSTDATHLGSFNGVQKFSVKGQLQAALADGATSAEFTVGNTSIDLGDVIFGTVHGDLMGGLSQSNMIIATRTANSMSFVFNNESGLVAVDDTPFTASFAIIK